MANEPAEPQIHANSLIKLFAVVAFLLPLLLSAQDQLTTGSKKAAAAYHKAEKAYALEDFDESKQLLHQAVSIDEKFIEAYLLLGEISAHTKKYQSAVNYYNTAIQIDSNFFKPVYNLLGESYYLVGDYQKAAQCFRTTSRLFPPANAANILAQRWLRKSELADSLVKQPVARQLKSGLDAFNTAGDEYINGIKFDNKTYLLTHKDRNKATSEGMMKEEFYIVGIEGEVYTKQDQFNYLESYGNYGAAAMTADGSKLYFAACGWSEGNGSCDICLVWRENDTVWSQPRQLPGKVNTSYWESQAALSADEKEMYFASNRPGGYGGSDIYKSVKLGDGSWSAGINLGPEINSQGDEMSPFIHADGKSLYFSSNGQAFSMGGRDIYFSRADETGRWTSPVNVGYPVNTFANEMNIVISADARMVFLTSDRGGDSTGFDILAFEPLKQEVFPQSVHYMQVVVLDKASSQRITAAFMLYESDTETTIQHGETDFNGTFFIALKPSVEYKLQLEKPGYLLYSEQLSIGEDVSNENSVHMATLEPLVLNKQVVSNNVLFETGKSTLRPSSFTELSNLAVFLTQNQQYRIEISGHTDAVGTDKDNLVLSEQRAKAVMLFLQEKGVAAARITTKGYGATKAVAGNETEEGRKLNRRTEIKIIDK